MKKILLIVLMGLIFSGCEDWFDISPKTEMKADDMFRDERGFRDALIGAYTLMTADQIYGKEMSMGFVEALAQTYDGLSTSLGSPYLNTAKFAYTETSEENRLKGIWKNQYKVIANINGMLSYIEDQKPVFSSGMYEVVKGEALALRGFLHFDLLRLFAPSPITGTEQQAIPYVDRYTNQSFSRLTVDQILQRIVIDVDSARNYLRKTDLWRPEMSESDSMNFSVYFRDRVLHLNYYAATALLARVHLYRGDKEKAFTCAKEVIDSERFPLIADQNIGVASRLFPGEHIFSLSKGKLNQVLENLFPQGGYMDPLSISAGKLNQIYTTESVSTDLRQTWWFEDTKIVKFNNSSRIPLMRVPEMYLIAAECAGTISEGLAYLNALRVHRNLRELEDFGGDRPGFEKALYEEIVRELLLDGQLFYYFKRNNMTELPGLGEPIDPKLVYCPPIPLEEYEFGNMNN